MKTPSSSKNMLPSTPRKQSLGDLQSIGSTTTPQAHHLAEVRTPGALPPTISQEPLANYQLINNNQLANNQFANGQVEASGSAASQGGLRPTVYSGQQSPSAWPSAFREYVGNAGHRRRSSVEEGTAGDDAPSGSTSGESGRKKLSDRVDNVILSIIFMTLLVMLAAALLISTALVKANQGLDDRSNEGLQLTETTADVHVLVVTLKPRTQSAPTERTEPSLETKFPDNDYTFAPDKDTRMPPIIIDDSSSLPAEESTESISTTLVASHVPTSSGGSDDGSSTAYVSPGADTSAFPASDWTARSED